MQELLKEICKVNNRLLIGIPRERCEAEKRLPLTPEAVDMLTDCGHRVLVESGAGLGINYSDNHFSEAGAEIVDTPAEVFQADLILKILPPLPVEIALMRPRTTVFSLVQFNLFAQEAFELMMAKRITAISYELMADEYNRFPVLNVTSEIEGAASITIASELLSNTQGGKGILLGGIPGVSPTEVVIIGAGNAGTVAARAALALGASVKVFDDDINKLRIIQQVLGQGLFTSTFHPNVLHNAFRSADVVIGAMRYINTRHRYIIAEDMIRIMKRGALVIDLRINQGGCFETSHATTHANPVYEINGVIHYCVANIPGAVPHTSTLALTNATLPYVITLANEGWEKACEMDHGLRLGLNIVKGKIVYQAVAEAFGWA